MTTKIVRQRTRYFIAVEGQGEQSFIKWLGELSDQNGIHVSLDCQPLGGGGYKSMLKMAVRYRRRKERHKAKFSILLLDADRADRDDGWTIAQLKQEAEKEKIKVCIQYPNQEGLLFRMLPGNEHLKPLRTAVHGRLVDAWPAYRKPVDARTLSSRFSLSDLHRVAQIDDELKNLLKMIGLL